MANLTLEFLVPPNAAVGSSSGVPIPGSAAQTAAGIPASSYNGAILWSTTQNTLLYWQDFRWLPLILTAAGNTYSSQYNNAGTLGGAQTTYVDATDGTFGFVPQSANTVIAAPTGGQLKEFSRNVATRQMPTFFSALGAEFQAQPLTGRNKVGWMTHPGDSANAPDRMGLNALTLISAVPTYTSVTTSASSANPLAQRMRRVGLYSSAVAGDFAGWWHNGVRPFAAGNNAPPGGGVFAIHRWVENDPAAVSGRRSFIGFNTATAAPTNVEPNTVNFSFGLVQLSTDATQWYFFLRGNRSTTPIAAGTSVGAPGGAAQTAWEFAVYSPPNLTGNTVYMQLTNLSSGVVASTSFPNSNTITGTVPLGFSHWITNNATAAQVGIDFVSLYIETDY